MRSPSHDALEQGVLPHPYFYSSDREGSGASLGLVPVTVPGCFGTNRKVYKCLGHKSLSLHHGRLSEGLLSFRTTGHCKYRVWSCMTFFCVTLAWFASPWKSVRPIPVLRRGWWAVFQHGRLSWAPPSWILHSAPDWLKFVAAIMDLENNKIHCSLNNSLLSFSAPDWLPVIWACITTSLSLLSAN